MMLQFSFDMLDDALQQKRSNVRKESRFAYAVLKEECERGLTTQRSLPKNFFASAAARVYKHAHNKDESEALECSLWALYEFQATAHPKLMPPAQFFFSFEHDTLICESMPPLRLQQQLYEACHRQLLSDDVNAESRYVVHALLLARQLGTFNPSLLCDVLKADIKAVNTFPDSRRATILLDKPNDSRVWLDAVALLHLQRAQELRKHALNVSKLSNLFVAWWAASNEQFSNGMSKPVTLGVALDALTFQSRVITAPRLSSISRPLNDIDTITASSGIRVNSNQSNLLDIEPRGAKRRSWSGRDFQEVGELLNDLTRNKQIHLALQVHATSADSLAFDQLRTYLRGFKSDQPDGSRKSGAFKEVKEKLVRLLEGSGRASSEVSATAFVILYYCVDLFINGSQWGPRLAVSTILTYLSTLSVFASSVWGDNDQLVLAQSDGLELSDLTELVANGLGDLSGVDKQGTILNFFAFLVRNTQILFFDSEELEYLGAGTIETRTHYVCPDDFERVCHEFLHDVDSPERQQCVQKMRLCYYAGLRSSEAELLTIVDVDLQIDALFITPLIRRKTRRAVRRVPLCFFLNKHLNELEGYVEKRKQAKKQTLFDSEVINAVRPLFIEMLRKQCNKSSLVVHSLRHSAATNILHLLCMNSFETLQGSSGAPFFLSHSLFSSEQLKRVSCAFEMEGRPINAHFQILDTLASLLGHVSPAVTAANYLHLFDYLLFELNAQRGSLPSTDYLHRLLPNNNHRFERVGQYSQALANSCEDAERLLFKSAIHGLGPDKKYPLQQSNLNLPSVFLPSLSSFIESLVAYKNQPAKNKNETLYAHFDSLKTPLETSSIEVISPRAYPAYVKLLDRLTKVSWNKKNERALETMRNILLEGYIRDRRELTRFFRAVDLIGLKEQKFLLQVAQNRGAEAWVKLIKRCGHTSIVKEGEGGYVRLQAKPAHIRWPLWSLLPQLLPIILTYVHYISTQQVKR